MLRARFLPTSRLPVSALLLALAVGCSSQPEQTTSSEQATTLVLAGSVPFTTLELPADVREGEEPPERIPLTGFRSVKGNHRTRLPIRSRNHYFFKPSPGMKVVHADGTEIPHKYFKSGAGPFWTYDANTLTLSNLPEGAEPTDYFLVYPRAVQRERSLNQAWSGKSAEEFAVTSVQSGRSAHTGLLLPAPGTAAWHVTVPPSAELRLDAGLIEPEILQGAGSDGAEVVVTFTPDGGEATEVARVRVDKPDLEAQRIDMDAFAGQQGELEIQSLPGAHNRYDYVFLANPRLASRRSDPRKVVMIFVDTLRPDHLGTYGYERPTSPALDALAQGGAVFENARNVAPWTLPSTRSVLTGMDPEYYFTSPTIQGRMREAGYATAMLAGNMYLGANFGIHRDWDWHHADLLPHAEDQLDLAIEWLDDHAHEDSFLLLHLMDAHLPYKEPDAYRDMWAGERPATLRNDVFHRGDVVRGRLDEQGKQYIRDRYDNNIRYIDDQLQRLFSTLDDDDIVVYFSDHGEEFWEHGGFEHGHTLYDEVLRVPLVIKGPGMEAGRVAEPVSLLDVVPTVLDMVGLPSEGTQGTSLVELAKGDAEAKSMFADRPQAFGRPLYGAERWGVLANDMKYATTEGREDLFDLAKDVGEKRNIAGKQADALPVMREQMGEALGREVARGYRLSNRATRTSPDEEMVVTFTVPGGIKAAWVGEDPTEASMASLQWEPGSDTVVATWPTGFRARRDIWVIPAADLPSTTPQIHGEVQVGSEKAPIDMTPKAMEPGPGRRKIVLGRGEAAGRGVEVGFTIGPIPSAEGEAVSAFDEETLEALKAMGYMSDDE